MDASLVQSAIVWAALGIGLASVLVCVLSASSSLTDGERRVVSDSQDDPAALLDSEGAG